MIEMIEMIEVIPTIPALATSAAIPMTIGDRFTDVRSAFDAPAVPALAIGVAAVLVLAPILIWTLRFAGKTDAALHRELVLRWLSWLVIAVLVIGAILLGPAWTILGVGVMSLLCYREYARATGLFREKLESLMVVAGICALTFATLDHWYGFFTALVPFTIGAIAVVAILRDRPKGYIQRVALAVFGFALFGSGLGHLGLIANDPRGRSILLFIVIAVALNDVFGFIVGKTLGRRKLCPNTSPKKTIAGSVGALVLTTALVAAIGSSVFDGTRLAGLEFLIPMGLMIGILGQLGDLMLSSIKRDLGIKDMAVVIPGHGGFLDRLDSIILVAPAMFHFVHYFMGIGTDVPKRLMTGP